MQGSKKVELQAAVLQMHRAASCSATASDRSYLILPASRRSARPRVHASWQKPCHEPQHAQQLSQQPWGIHHPHHSQTQTDCRQQGGVSLCTVLHPQAGNRSSKPHSSLSTVGLLPAACSPLHRTINGFPELKTTAAHHTAKEQPAKANGVT